MAFEFGNSASIDWAKILVAGFLLAFFLTGILGILFSKSLIIYAYDKARRCEMHNTAEKMRELVESGGSKEDIAKEAKRQASLEKMSRPQVDRHKFFSIFPQVLVAAAPLVAYGNTELLEFFIEVSNIIAPG